MLTSTDLSDLEREMLADGVNTLRSRERQRLPGGFTGPIVRAGGVDRARVRGQCRRVAPQHWNNDGTLASEQPALISINSNK